MKLDRHEIWYLENTLNLHRDYGHTPLFEERHLAVLLWVNYQIAVLAISH